MHLSGEAEAILARAQATAKGIALVSQSLKENGGVEDSNKISLSTFMVSCISCDGIGKRVGIIVILINVKYSMPKSRKTSIPGVCTCTRAEQYVQAFSNIAKEGTTMLLPSSTANPASMIAQALTLYKSLVKNASADGSHINVSHELPKSTKDAPSAEPEVETLESSRSMEARDMRHDGQPGFSLQSPKKKE
ncbi:hypothetical protein F3Y22_tig00111166pilonHSYRG00395 [Hibiscus syriacus]|uniref:STML2-like C-terminal extension domain-containing protein n=1 Tax=Hibiscus syriacus TaxID=106335 RepID=A0A6A2YXF9_HIBSY|nr:hypothetical protein F3Y22_tig00111166pilonHSYRG00395 [Hibiscus syriacus]